jgi:ribosome biogenesis GTPase A
MPFITQVDPSKLKHIQDTYAKIFELNRSAPLVVVTFGDTLDEKLRDSIDKELSHRFHGSTNIKWLSCNGDFMQPLRNWEADYIKSILQQVENRFNVLTRNKIHESNHEFDRNHKINVLLVGPHHSGKSALINKMYLAYNPQIPGPVCAVGRESDPGTLFYDRIEINSKFAIFDTAGKPFEDGDTDLHMQYIKALQSGKKSSTNLITLEELYSKESDCLANKIDALIMVINAASNLCIKVWVDDPPTQESGCLIQ